MRKIPKQVRSATRFLTIITAVGLLQFLLANERPLYCVHEGRHFFPAFKNLFTPHNTPFDNPWLEETSANKAWKYVEYDFVVFSPIPFGPNEALRQNPLKNAAPGTVHPGLNGTYTHWLGTDSQGFDVAAQLMAGARIALLTGLLAMGIAAFIGLLLGATAGYFGDHRLRIRISTLLISIFFTLPMVFFYVFLAPWSGVLPSPTVRIALIITTLIIIFFLGHIADRLLRKVPWFGGYTTFPADLFIMRGVELFNSVPGLVAIIAAAAAFNWASRWAMIAFIGVMSWTGVAKLVRAEMLRVRELDFIQAARALGLPESRTLIFHALPNAIRPVFVAFAFGMGGAILLEAALSFLGFGGDQQQSWGTLLERARDRPADWWVSIPPGLAIVFTVLSLNRIGEYLSDPAS